MSAKGATLKVGGELVIGAIRIIIDSIDCRTEKVKLRAVTDQYVSVRKPNEPAKESVDTP